MTGEKISVQINGKDYEFAVNYGLMRRIGENTKSDPFTIDFNFQLPAEQYKYAYNILLGGLVHQKVTPQQIQEEVDTWDFNKLVNLVNTFNAFFTVTPKNGEVVDPQRGALMDGNSGNSVGRIESSSVGA